MGFSHWKFGVAFPGVSKLRQSRATKPTVHTGCFSVSIIHRILTRTTGSLTCTQILMHAHGSVLRTHARQSALQVDSGRKIPCRTGESNLPQRRAGRTPFQLSYIHTPTCSGPKEKSLDSSGFPTEEETLISAYPAPHRE